MLKTDKYELALSALGNTLTWYNFALFMPFLHILSKNFFPAEGAATSSMMSFLVVSIGLFMRPVGATTLGPIGDVVGRQRALMISILLMAVPTFCIGLLPNYASIGFLSPIILLFFRALQGVSLGGEFVAAMVHLVELAPTNRRGFMGSLSEAGAQIGALLASSSLVMLYMFYTEAEIYEYAWRYPFLAAILLVPFAFIHPHKEAKQQKKSKGSVVVGLLKHKKEMLCSIGITSFTAVAFYTSLTFLPYYLVREDVLTLREATQCSMSFNISVVVASIFFGYLSDMFKRKPFLKGGIIGATVVTYFIFLVGAASVSLWKIINVIAGFFVGMHFSSRAAFFSEAFSKNVRCTGVAVSISVAQAVVGGSTAMVMDFCTSVSPWLAVVPITIVATLGLFSLAKMQDRTGMELQ